MKQSNGAKNRIRYINLGSVSKEMYTGLWEYRYLVDIKEPTMLQWSLNKESVVFCGVHPTDITHILDSIEDKIRYLIHPY